MAAPLLQEHPPPLGPSRIARLAPTTAQLVRSAAVVPSLPRILAELVQNSIDASANSISCTVDLDTWTIKCDDNGRGFTALDLDCLARAQRYSTSKVTLAHIDNGQQGVPSPVGASPSSYYGSRGEALVSLQYVATVEIRTRALHDPVARELVLRQGMCLAHGDCAIERPNHGASVVVRDIFHNLPVRRRALEKPAAHNSLVSSLRATLASLALIHPAIAFSLLDKTSSLSTNTAGTKTLLSVRPSPTGLVSARWRQLWGPTAVEKVNEFETEEESEANNGGACRAKGFFSLAPAHTKAQQYIYVNSRPLSATHSSLHKLVNSLFEASSFAKHASAASAPSPPVARQRSSSQQQQQQKRPFERHPVFALALEVPARGVSVAFEQENGVAVEFEEPARIEAFVTGIVKRFLIQHGFAHAPVPKKTLSLLAAPSQLSSSLDAQLRKKRPRSDSSAQTGDETAATGVDAVVSDRDRTAMTSGARSLNRLENRTLRAEIASKELVPLVAIAGPAELDTGAADDRQPPKMMRWTDPVTNILWEIDTRTGNSRRVDPTRLHHRSAASEELEKGGGAAESSPPPPPMTKASSWIVDRSALRSRNEGLNDSTETGGMPAWLEAKLATWTNPVFPAVRPEKTIPTLPVLPIASNLAQSSLRDIYPSSKKKRFVDTATAAAKPTRKDIDAFCCTSAMLTNSVPEPMSIPMAKISSSSSVQVSDPASASAPSSTPFSGQTFSRESLARAEFVAQVDRKYLLAKLPVAGERRSPLATTQTLVLVDQHAASERVRVERFLDATVGNVARGESIATIRCGRDEADDPDEAERAPRSVENRIGIVVGRREYELARQYRTVFARWGFTLAFDDDDDEAPPPSPSFSPTTGGDGGGGGDYHQIWLESVPDLVSNRLLTKTKDSHLAQDLVRSFVAHLEGNGPGVAGDVEYTAAGGDGGGGAGRRRGRGGWTSAIKDAPPVLIELLNSKACRGAIMFNDELSAAQAESLLAKLAETIYPFQCAHGRPSVVPVVNLAPPRPSPAIDPGVDWSRLM